MTQRTTLRASSAERYLACPGSYEAQHGLPQTTSAAAESGHVVHEAIDHYIAHGELPETDMTLREAFVARWFGDVVIRERGLAQPKHILTTNDSLKMVQGNVTWIGHPDRVEVFEDVIHIWEYKTGYGKQLDASEHVQGRMYVAMVGHMYMAKMPFARIVLHLLSAGQDAGEWHTVCEFNIKDIDNAIHEAIDIGQSVLNNSDRRVADTAKQCRYCRAAGNVTRCPESVKACVAMELPPVLLPTDAKSIVEAYSQWNELKAKLKAVQVIGEKIEQAMRDMLKSGQSPEGCGYKLLPETQQRRVTAAMKVWQVVQDTLTAEEFGDLIKLSFSDLEKAMYKARKAVDKKITHEAVEGELRAMLEAAGCIKRVPVEGKIVREE